MGRRHKPSVLPVAFRLLARSYASWRQTLVWVGWPTFCQWRSLKPGRCIARRLHRLIQGHREAVTSFIGDAASSQSFAVSSASNKSDAASGYPSKQERPVLCFEVWRNGEKLTTAGVSEGVVSVILHWVGKGTDASSVAASSSEAIPGVHCVVGGIDGATSVDWYETDQLKIGDEVRIRLISSDQPDPPVRTQTVPRGNPDWVKQHRPK